jgi:hypothetical protein
MPMYVYATGGPPVGFVFETTIYDLTGAPAGRIVGSRVHRFDGTYVGEWFQQMVVERAEARPRSIPPRPLPRALTPPAATSPRRQVADYLNYVDAFDLLHDAAMERMQVAAE